MKLQKIWFTYVGRKREIYIFVDVTCKHNFVQAMFVFRKVATLGVALGNDFPATTGPEVFPACLQHALLPRCVLRHPVENGDPCSQNQRLD